MLAHAQDPDEEKRLKDKKARAAVDAERSRDKELKDKAAAGRAADFGSPLTDEEARSLASKVVTPPKDMPVEQLFEQVHPTRLAFMRRQLTTLDLERPYEHFGFDRPDRIPNEGEAVLIVKDVDDSRSNYRLGGWLQYFVIWTLTGEVLQVKSEWLNASPVPKRKPAPITASDLSVADESGKYLGGPPDFVVVDTGWALEREPAWLASLPAGDARFEQFRAAQAKVISCYQKKRAEYDPDGNLARYYDVATYGPNGVAKLESAATNFDRRACAACGCKAFNQKRVALAKQVLAPLQKAQFEKSFAPVVKKLNALK